VVIANKHRLCLAILHKPVISQPSPAIAFPLCIQRLNFLARKLVPEIPGALSLGTVSESQVISLRKQLIGDGSYKVHYRSRGWGGLLQPSSVELSGSFHSVPSIPNVTVIHGPLRTKGGPTSYEVWARLVVSNMGITC
jgi:hypothetical protein